MIGCGACWLLSYPSSIKTPRGVYVYHFCAPAGYYCCAASSSCRIKGASDQQSLVSKEESAAWPPSAQLDSCVDPRALQLG